MTNETDLKEQIMEIHHQNDIINTLKKEVQQCKKIYKKEEHEK